MLKTYTTGKDDHGHHDHEDGGHNDNERSWRDTGKVGSSSMKRKSDGSSMTKRVKGTEEAVAVTEAITPSPNLNGRDISPRAFQELMENRKVEFKRQLREKLEKEVERLKNAASGSDSFPTRPNQIWANLLDSPSSDDDYSLILLRNPAYNEEDVDENRVRDILLPLMLNFKGPFIKNLSECPIWDPKFLQLRQVSRCVRDAMDRCFDEELEAAMWNNNKEFWDWWTDRKSIQLYMPYNADSFKKILEMKPPLNLIRKEMEVTIKSPSKMPSYKNKSPSMKYLDHFNMFKDNVTKVLNQVGNQILSFEFTFGKMSELEENGISITQIYWVLKEWLELLPNLKWLKIGAGVGCASRKKLKIPAIEALKKVDEATLFNQPPPMLDFLVRLDISVTSDYDYDYFSIGDIIAAANPHIRMLYYYGNDFDRRVPNSCIEWLGLESLILECRQYNNEPTQLLRNLSTPNSRWNLKQLTLYVNLKGAPVNSLFDFLNKSPSLVDLTLAIGRITIGGEIDFLRLPKVKNFSIEFDPIIFEGNFNENAHFFFSLQFLLYCGKLESIEWKNLGRDSGQLQRDIELHRKQKAMVVGLGFKEGEFNDVYDSNLRDTFPHLKEICVESRGLLKKWYVYDDSDTSSE